MTDVDAYIANLDPSIRKLAEKVRSVTARALPGALESLKMGIPTYSINGISIAAIADFTSTCTSFRERDCPQLCWREPGRECGT